MARTAGGARGRVVARLEAGGSYQRWVLLTALAGMFATTFPITVLTLAIPDMAADFEVSQTTLAWVVTLPILLSALSLPVLGKLGDLYGHRRTFLLGFGLATLTTAVTPLAWNAASLIFFRSLTQVIGAATQPSSLALINTEYPPDERPRAMGWWAMVAAGAPVVGLAAGGPLIDAFGWEVVFLLQAATMVVPVVVSWLVLRETRRKVARFDMAGSLSLILGVGGLMVAVSRGDDWGWLDPKVMVALLSAGVGIVLFVKVEARVSSPLLPLDFFGRRDFSASIGASLFGNGAYMGAYFIATLMLRNEFGYSVFDAAKVIAVRPLVFALASPLGGRLTERYGNRAVAVGGDVVMTMGLVALAVGAWYESIVVVFVGLVVQGLGQGIVRPPLTTALVNAVDEEDLGIAAAAERLMGQIGVAVGITALTVIYGGVDEPSRFAWAFAASAAMALVAVPISAALRGGGAVRARGAESRRAPV